MRVPSGYPAFIASAVAATVVVAAFAGCAGSVGPVGSVGVAAVPSAAPSAASWSYAGVHGPAEWGRSCAPSTTAQQSPVNIATADLKDSGAEPLRPSYHAAAFRVENTGHGIDLVPADHTVNAIESNGKSYRLTRLRFHAASEHMIDGIASAAELQLVHTADDGSTAVLAVLLTPGTENEQLAEVFSALPAQAALPGRAWSLEQPIDPMALVPAATPIAQYEGSLTTPPCTEGVLWGVFLAPVSVSPAQLAALTQLYPGNHRPIQPLNGRTITAAHLG